MRSSACAYSYQLSALGYAGGGATWTASGSLPAGLSLSAAGVVSGTPTTAGFPNISFSLTDGVDTVFKSVNFTIYAVRITTPGVLPNATQNACVQHDDRGRGRRGRLHLQRERAAERVEHQLVVRRHLGHGEFEQFKPRQVSVNVTAKDSGNVSYTKTMSIDVVGAAPALPSIAPSGSFIYDCTLGVACNRTISVQNGGTAPFTWTATGLPPGMSIRFGSGTTSSFVTPGDAQLWGTPTATGHLQRAADGDRLAGATATNTFPMNVSPLLQTTFLQSGTIDTAYSQTLRVLGGTGPYSARADRRAARRPA